MHKKEDDLAAFLLAGLLPQSWRRAASSVLRGAEQSSTIFSLVIGQSRLCLQLMPSTNHITSSTLPVFVCWFIYRWKKQASALILQAFAVACDQQGSEEITSNNTLYCHQINKKIHYSTRFHQHGLIHQDDSWEENRLVKVPLKRTITAAVV